MAAYQISDEIRRNFHLFWDNYPAAVILAYKDHTIVDVNKIAQERGYPVGVQCISMGEKKHHAGCKLHIALEKKTAIRDMAYIDFLGQGADTYWIPLAGAEDYYVHFSYDITEYGIERLFPKSCTGVDCTSCAGT